MKKIIQILCLTTAVAFVSGCATIVSEKDYPVAIQSVPSNVSFTIRDESGNVIASGKTPQTVTLKAGAGYFKKGVYEITFKKKDYPVRKTTLKAELDGWYWGNFVFGGLLGLLVIDPISGAMYKLPPTVSMNLKKPTKGLTVMSIDSLSDEQKAQLQALN